MLLLLTEDNLELAQLTSQNLRSFGFATDLASTAKQSLQLLQNETSYDVAILDLNLPDDDGLRLLQKFKKLAPHLPVLALTAKDSQEDKIVGLKAGFDDYLTKPFSAAELASRLKVLTRLPRPGEKKATISFHQFKINPLNQSVYKGKKLIKLSLNEFRLLLFLAQNLGQIISAQKILETVWDMNTNLNQAKLVTTICRLRQKLGDKNKKIIKTTEQGYTIEK